MRKVTKIPRAAHIVLAVFSLLIFQTAIFAQDKAHKIDELMSPYHKFEQFNGAVLVADHGKVIYKKGLGLANMEWNIPNEPDTKFRLGSITKQFTAALILQLVEQGKIKLDGKVSDYLPDYRKDTGAKITIHLGPSKLVVPVVEHNGGINGFSTIIVRLVGDKRLVVLLDNTSQGRYLDRIALGITNILYDQPYALPRRSIREGLLKVAVENGAPAAIARYRTLKAEKASEYDFSETELNTLGYQLLQRKKVAEAIEIFKLNVEAYPQSANTYDSLGEAYTTHGDKELAIANYQKSLELDRKNTGATRMLAVLSGEQKDVGADPKPYEAYAGDYELAPNFIITVTLENGKLLAQATGQPKAEIYASSATEFFYKVVDAQITFVKNEQGQVTELILHQNGRNMPAKKIR